MMIEILKQEQEEKQKEIEGFKEEIRKTLKEHQELKENRTKEMRNLRRNLKWKWKQ